MNIQVELSGVDINFGSHYHRDSIVMELVEIICDHGRLKIKP